jgi:hypothetical protein
VTGTRPDDCRLPALTEEELAAAGWPGPLPLVRALPAAARAAAVDAGRRSLVARGLLAAGGLPSPVLRAVVAVARAAAVLVEAERSSPGGTATARWHRSPSGRAVLEQRPGADGVHRFAFRTIAGAAGAVAAFADPERRAPATGTPASAPTDPRRAVASATTVTRVGAVRRGRGPGPAVTTAAVTVATGPLGTWVVAADGRRAVAHPAGEATLVDLFRLALEVPYIDSGAVTPSIPSPTTSPILAASTSHSLAAVSSGGTPSPIT